MNNSILKFGKFKGQDYFSTPLWYQEWLSKQNWFTIPDKLTSMGKAQKEFSEASRGVKGWNGYSQKGEAAYNRMFKAEMDMENLMYCDCGNMKEHDQRTCGFCGGAYSL